MLWVRNNNHPKMRKLWDSETGPTTTTRVNKYLFLLYGYKSNIYIFCTIKASTEIEFIRVVKDPHEHLVARVLKIVYMRLHKESSPTFQQELQAKGIDFQLAPPGMHRCNVDERSIIIFRDHFIIGLC